MKKQLQYIHYAKALGIILIVLGHFLPAASAPRILIYSFHVPLFIVVSGILTRAPQTVAELSAKIRKSFFRTVIPYAVWFALSSLPLLLTGKMKPLVAVKYFFFLDGTTIWNSALWFIPCYFIIVAVFSTFLFFSKGKRYLSASLCLVSFACAAILNVLKIGIPLFGLDKCIMLMGFLALEYTLSPAIRKATEFRLQAVYILSFVLFAAAAVILNWNNNISLMQLDYNNVFVFIILACALSVSFILSCSAFGERRVIKLLSENSLFIMCSHLFVRQLLYVLVGDIPMLLGLAVTSLLVIAYTVALCFADTHIKSEKIKKLLTVTGISLSNHSK